MIIRESTRGFVMVRQHDHALLAGDIALHFRKEFFSSPVFFEETMQAVYQHDRSWIYMDDVPLWNDLHQAPMAFMEYPALPKITFYKIGLDEIEAMNAYAGLLCSLHYTSFFSQPLRQEEKDWLAYEQDRQSKLRATAQVSDEALLLLHFQLLQLCDNLSLYVCLNKPGIEKSQEHPWYRQGFHKSEAFSSEQQKPLTASWLDAKSIQVTPSPFDGPFQTKLIYKEVSKEALHQKGMREAYEKAPWQEQEIAFR